MSLLVAGQKNRDSAHPLPDPKFTALDDSTKIQLEIERQTLTQTIDSLKAKLKEIEDKEKAGPLDDEAEDEKDRLREQLDSLYRQRNDLFERIQKKIDESSSKGKKKDGAADATKSSKRSEETSDKGNSKESKKKQDKPPKAAKPPKSN